MYVNEMAKALKVHGHDATLLVKNATRKPLPEGMYDLSHYRRASTVAGRFLDRLTSRASVDRKLNEQTIIGATRKAAQEREVDLLEMEESFGWSLRIRPALKIPVVVRLHGPWFLNGQVKNISKSLNFLKRVRDEGEAIRKADGVSASSLDVLERTRAYYHIPLEHAEVIHPPAPSILEERQWSSSQCEAGSLLFVGRFDRHKGCDIVIQAFARIAERFPAARLRIVGPDQGLEDDKGRTWSFLEYINYHVDNLDVLKRIEWLGQLPNSEVMSLRQKSFLSIVCSRYDNFPTSVTEAMAMGCPVIASDTGGISEQITHGVTGLLCRPADPYDLAEKVCLLLDQPDLAARLGMKARQDIETRLSSSFIGLKMISFYENVIERYLCNNK